jgi:predicted RNase H-like nuclease (RuvC/YqgF family)
MTDDRADLMLEILKGIQADIGVMKRDLSSLTMRTVALEEHQRGLLTSIHGMQADMSDLRTRVDRIERRLGLTDTEH